MATARNLNLEPEAGYVVTFLYSNGVLTVNKAAMLISGYGFAQSDGVAFSNSASSTATIQLNFLSNPPVTNPPGPNVGPLFNYPANPLLLAPGASTGYLNPLLAYGAVNYYVTVNGNNVGDIYAIQAGDILNNVYGPLYVAVSGSDPTPATVVVPYQGRVEFYSIDGLTHPITWGASAGSPFQGLTAVYPLNNPNTKPYKDALPANDFPYSLGAGIAGGGGGGTVRIKQTS